MATRRYNPAAFGPAMLAPGVRLGQYEIVAPLGAGGMGEVYRARDDRLRRDVAIKVLRPGEGGGAPRQRLLQEARLAGGLNHPHIVTVHDVGSTDGADYIVMELVAGRTLETLIRPGLAPREALRIAIAVADALAAAHRRGIVHRDLKPSNVLVGEDGTVKVLDFGVAVEAVPAFDGAADEDTTRSASDRVAVGGTPAYMSPEQATGDAVDSRSDIFSFGTLLYEMLTRRRAFTGDSPAALIASVVSRDPTPPRHFAPAIPPELDTLVQRCLRKDRERRAQHMEDVKVELLEALERMQSVPAPPRHARRGRRAAAAVATLALLAAAAWMAARPRGATTSPRVVALTTTRGAELMPSLSPDGEQVAFSWEGEAASASTQHLWVKLVGTPEARRLTHSDHHDLFAAWSPDGRSIAFLRSTRRYNAPPPLPFLSGTLHVVSPLGGPARKLSPVEVATSQIAWSPDGQWVAARSATTEGGLILVPVEGGSPRVLSRPVAPRFDAHPAFSPDGRHLAYASCSDRAQPIPSCDVYAVTLAAELRPEGEPRRLTATPAGVINGLAWTRDGAAVVYSVGLTLGRSYLWRLDVGGAPPQRIEVAGRGAAFPAIARTKDHMVFAHALFDLDIYRFEPGVRGSTAHVSSSFEDAAPSFSPDGQRIAYDSGRSGHNEEIWLADADGSNPVQLTRGPNRWQGSPRWSPDGRQIVFDSWSEDRLSDVWTIDVDGGPPRRLTSGPLAEAQAIWSRDGQWIYYSQTEADGRRDFWRMPAGGGAGERITEHGGIIARESPDGRTLFFTPRERTSPLMSRPVAGGPERQVVDCVLTRSLADGPDGMYYLGCPLEAREAPLFRLDPATGRSHLLGHVETGGVPVYGLAVSPDGRSVLYTRIVAQGADLMLIEGFR